MDNLLPRFESFVIDSNDGSVPPAKGAKADDLLEKYKSWRPEKTVVTATTVSPFGLPISADYSEVYNQKKKTAIAGNLPAPNEKFLPDPWDDPEPSLLDERSRGKADSAHIYFDNKDKTKIEVKSDYRPPKFRTNIPLLLKVYNYQRAELDVFIQRNSSIIDLTLRPNAVVTKLVAGEVEDKKTYSTLDILVSISGNIFIATTVRQEIRDFEFGIGPIGIEAEMAFGRLTCTRILPDSQAEQHAHLLENSIILAVNDIRVTTLDEFRGVITAVLTDEDNNYASIVIKALVYKSQKIKLDALYAQSLQKNNANVTKMLSTLLRGGGVDAEHQHDVELRARDDDSDDEGSSAAATQSTSTYGYAPRGKREAKHVSEHKGEHKGEDKGEDKSSPSPSVHSAEGCDAKSARGGSATSEAKGTSSSRAIEHDDGGNLYASKATNQRSNAVAADDNASALSLEDFEDDRSLASQPKDGMFITEIDSALTQKEEEQVDDAGNGYDMTCDDPDHIERSDIGPYTRVVCVPRVFQGSKKWGDPQDFLQLTNYSSRLCIQLYWLDSEGALIPRKLLSVGERYVDLVSSNHVYALVALPHWQEGGSSSPVDYSALSEYVLHDQAAHTVMLRPSASSLVKDRCTTITWVPGYSLTATQLTSAKGVPRHKERLPRGDEEKVEALLQVHILDKM